MGQTTDGRLIDNAVVFTQVAADTMVARTIVVPANRRWVVYCGIFQNGDVVNRSAVVIIMDASSNLFVPMYDTISGGDHATFPMTRTAGAGTAFRHVHSFNLSAGMQVYCFLSAGVGGNPNITHAHSVVVKELIV